MQCWALVPFWRMHPRLSPACHKHCQSIAGVCHDITIRSIINQSCTAQRLRQQGTHIINTMTCRLVLSAIGLPRILMSMERSCALQCTQSTTTLRAICSCLLRVLPATSTRPTAVCNGGRCVRGLRQAGLGGKDGSLISALAAASHTTPADLLLQQWECIIVSGRLRDQKNVSGHFEPPSLTLPLSNNLADTCLQV